MILLYHIEQLIFYENNNVYIAYVIIPNLQENKEQR